MAAITIPGTTFPALYTQSSVGTTLQEFVLPRGVRKVAVLGDAAVWIQFTGSDGGAVAANAKFPGAANAGLSWELYAGGERATSVFVAAQSGTATVSVSCEGG